jgi:acyl-CoA thioesterase II
MVPAPCGHDDPSPTCELLRQLALTPSGTDTLSGHGRGGRTDHSRVFGGFLAAQSVLAAAATVEADRQPDSLHISFLTPGNVAEALDYHVTTLREGTSTSARQVIAAQDGRVRATAVLSFTHVRPSANHQHTVAIEPVPEAQRHEAEQAAVTSGLDYRYVDDPAADAPTRLAWLRCPHDLGDDPLWHAVVLAFASDLGVGRVVDLPHQNDPGRRRSASLDHAVWFHRAARADDWIQYRLSSPVYVGGRGLAQGELADAGGRLLATVTQRIAISRRL